jgi:hypothetical protein
MKAIRFPLVAVAAIVSACASAPPPPLLALPDAQTCSTHLDLSDATPVTLKDGESVTRTFDGTSECWVAVDGSKSVYAVFRLPEAGTPYIVTVDSAPTGTALLPPQAMLLDKSGVVQREIGRDSFQFHGAILRGGIRIHAGDAYLVVRSDPRAVGKSVSQIVEATHEYVASTAAFMMIVHSGSEDKDDYTYSYNGIVTVSAQPLPAAE